MYIVAELVRPLSRWHVCLFDLCAERSWRTDIHLVLTCADEERQPA
jgi:hypothetical protein